MSHMGQPRRLNNIPTMSALPPTPDIRSVAANDALGQQRTSSRVSGPVQWFWLRVMGHHVPAPVDLLENVCHDPIDVARGTVFHQRMSDFCPDFPCQIADYVNTRAGD